jgi:glycine/D-amino acid oxidase-like deaminating enzyme
MVKEKSVIIVGAGIAGSCTAYHLNQAGWDITLIDEKK